MLTCQTPTMAFAMRISRMTKGSTKAVTVSSPSSNQARTFTNHRDMNINEWRHHKQQFICQCEILRALKSAELPNKQKLERLWFQCGQVLLSDYQCPIFIFISTLCLRFLSFLYFFLTMFIIVYKIPRNILPASHPDQHASSSTPC